MTQGTLGAGMCVCEDWRTAPDELVLTLIAAEARRWLGDLGWDVATSWAVLNPARRAGVLHGYIARDHAGGVVGWTCFVLHQGTAQVAILVSSDASTTRALVAAITGSKAATKATGCTFFVREAPGLGDCFSPDTFVVERYRYKSKAHLAGEAKARIASEAGSSDPVARPWQAGDERKLPALLQRAYLDVESPRPFAAGGTLNDWREYTSQLLVHSDCGIFRPGLSVVMDGDHGDLSGAAIVTGLGPRVVHLAQIAVEPGTQGRGVARTLLAAVMGTAAAAEASAITLLVAESNRAAVALYDSAGFRDAGAFLLAMRVPAGDIEGADDSRRSLEIKV